MYYKRNINAEQITTTAYNGSYAMRVSEVFEQQFQYRIFYLWDAEVPHNPARRIAATVMDIGSKFYRIIPKKYLTIDIF